MFQIVVNTGTNATEYEEAEVVEGSRVNRDMAFDHTGDFVYVVTLRKVGHSPQITVIRVCACGVCLGARTWCVCVRACVLECVMFVCVNSVSVTSFVLELKCYRCHGLLSNICLA